jgi:hypothetical protein
MKISHISDTSTSGPRMIGLLLPLSDSYSAHANLSHGRAMAQAVSRRPLTAEARVRSRASPRGICGRQSGTGTGFPLSISFHRCSITRNNEKLIVFITELHSKPQGCGASVASAAGLFKKITTGARSVCLVLLNMICRSHMLIVEVVIPRKQRALGHKCVWSFFFILVHRTRM